METKYENDCRVEFYELLKTTERISGYSPSQLVSVMVVMKCDADYACELLDKLDNYFCLDWSEASWWEMRITFLQVKKYLSDVVNTQ